MKTEVQTEVQFGPNQNILERLANTLKIKNPENFLFGAFLELVMGLEPATC